MSKEDNEPGYGASFWLVVILLLALLLFPAFERLEPEPEIPMPEETYEDRMKEMGQRPVLSAPTNHQG